MASSRLGHETSHCRLRFDAEVYPPGWWGTPNSQLLERDAEVSFWDRPPSDQKACQLSGRRYVLCLLVPVGISLILALAPIANFAPGGTARGPWQIDVDRIWALDTIRLGVSAGLCVFKNTIELLRRS